METTIIVMVPVKGTPPEETNSTTINHKPQHSKFKNVLKKHFVIIKIYLKNSNSLDSVNIRKSETVWPLCSFIELDTS